MNPTSSSIAGGDLGAAAMSQAQLEIYSSIVLAGKLESRPELASEADLISNWGRLVRDWVRWKKKLPTFLQSREETRLVTCLSDHHLLLVKALGANIESDEDVAAKVAQHILPRDHYPRMSRLYEIIFPGKGVRTWSNRLGKFQDEVQVQFALFEQAGYALEDAQKRKFLMQKFPKAFAQHVERAALGSSYEATILGASQVAFEWDQNPRSNQSVNPTKAAPAPTHSHDKSTHSAKQDGPRGQDSRGSFRGRGRGFFQFIL